MIGTLPGTIRSAHIALLVAAIAAIVPVNAHAADEFVRAASTGSTVVELCNLTRTPHPLDACQDGVLDQAAEQLEAAFQATLAKIAATTRPLLKRDQVWFRNIVETASEPALPKTEEFAVSSHQDFAAALRQRIAMLGETAEALGRTGVGGRWANAFGSIEVTPTEGGAYRVAITTSTIYGIGSQNRNECGATAQVRPSPSGWLSGNVLPNEAGAADPTEADEHVKPVTGGERPPQALIKMRRQGETLRVVADDGNHLAPDAGRLGCQEFNQITGSYFAVGKTDSVGPVGTRRPAFVAPTFDCSRPATATEEEICADPDLAKNDHELKRAWTQLLPRLDEPTRRVLVLDQRGYMRSQAGQYPQFLNPAWEKQRGNIHHTGDARDKLNRLQRERIAVLRGFDEKRRGFKGLWMAHNAILNVERSKDGGLTAKGRRWEQGDWKAGCDFEFAGKAVGGVFQAEEKRTNPDTLDREHASMTVNRQDDVFARRRSRADGTRDPDADDAKCRRNVAISSTTRLFPVRRSPDIDNIGGSIR